MIAIILKRLPIILGAFAAGVYYAPATDKLFYNKAAQAGFFTNLGYSNPETVVLLLGLFELAVMIAFTFGIAGRFVAVAVLIEMAVALIQVGVRPNNIAVIVCAIGILLLGTGAHSLWQPMEERFKQWIPIKL